MKPRNLLYLSYLGGLGGGESSLLSYLCALDRARFTPIVICGKRGALVDELEARGILHAVIPFRVPRFGRGIVPLMSPAFFPRLYQFARAHDIHLMHCNDIETTYYAGFVTRALRVPLLWTCHGWWQVERGWKMTFVEKFVAHILTPTRYLAQCLESANPRLRERITVMPFGVDTNEFAPARRDPMVRDEFAIAHDAPLVTMLARYQSVKGHANLLDAAPLILDAFPAARFLLVGGAVFETNDAKATRQMIQARAAADERLRRAIVFADFRRDIPRVLGASDVLVCPSDFESYGLANLEAMACGVPVVSTNVGGPSETIVDGETGFLVPPRDPAALAARVNQLLGDRDLRARMGAKGRARVLEDFALEASARQLQDIYARAFGPA